jgi:short-subunit dehydrogenase
VRANAIHPSVARSVNALRSTVDYQLEQNLVIAAHKQNRGCLLQVQAGAQGTPVPKDTMLVVGSTGTLGRQVVRKALDAGYDVRCTVRPRQTPADFLRDWGATTVQVHTILAVSVQQTSYKFCKPDLLLQVDLNDPTSIPAALVGIHTVVDCATARPEESAQKIDWDGKVALIQCAQVACFCLFHHA